MLRVLGFIILLQISCYSPLTFADGVNPNVVAVGSAFERELQTFTSITANKQSKSAERTLLSARLQFQKLLKEDPTDFRSYLAMGTFLMTLSVPEGAARQHWEDVTSMLGAAAARIPTTAPSHLRDLLNNGLRKSRQALLREERRVVQELVNRCDDSTKTMKDVMNVTSELLHATTNAVDESSGVASSDAAAMYHDLAQLTLYTCIDQHDDSGCEQVAAQHLANAARSSAAAFFLLGGAPHLAALTQQRCAAESIASQQHVHLLPSSSLKCPAVQSTVLHSIATLPQAQATLITFTSDVLLMGRDGVLLSVDSSAFCECELLVPSADLLTNVAANVQMHLVPAQYSSKNTNAVTRASRRTPPTVLFPSPGVMTLSLVHFASGSFYHWMCEALPRLAMILFDKERSTSNQLRIILPTVNNSVPHYVHESLEAIRRTVSAARSQDWVFEYFPHRHQKYDVLVRERLTVVAFPPSPATALSVIPADALQLTNAMIRKVVVNSHRENKAQVDDPAFTSKTIIFVARSVLSPVPTGGYQRTLGNEAEVVTALKRCVESANRIHASLQWRLVVRRDDDANNTNRWLTDMATFYHADVIVGVHGGALANLIAAKPSATLIELGFARTPAAQHYSHLARALNLHYVRVPLRADDCLRAVTAPKVWVEDVAAFEGTVRQVLKHITDVSLHSSLSDEL